jgi:hypothetical protein
MVKTDKGIFMFRIRLLLQCNKRTAASSRRTVRDENQAMDSATTKTTDGLVPRQARTRGGGSSGTEETELNTSR